MNVCVIASSLCFFNLYPNNPVGPVVEEPIASRVVEATKAPFWWNQNPTLSEFRSYYKVTNIQKGIMSFYAGKWIGRKTANGEIYKKDDITAAHKTLPFNTKVRVHNLKNGKSLVVRINNRGPFIKGRIIDVSEAVAKELEMVKCGIVPVKVEVLEEVEL